MVDSLLYEPRRSLLSLVETTFRSWFMGIFGIVSSWTRDMLSSNDCGVSGTFGGVEPLVPLFPSFSMVDLINVWRRH